jgi:uncharacterized phage-associated protein
MSINELEKPVISDPVDVTMVADYLLYLDQATDAPDVCPIKLQKLLYYAQAQWLAATGQRMFAAPIEAWKHGPVVNRVYAKHAASSEPIVVKRQIKEAPALPVDVCAFLDQIWDQYGQFATWKLVAMTHDERPWRDNFTSGESHTVIPDEDMIRWFHASPNAILHPDVTLLTDDDLAAVNAVDDDRVLAMWTAFDA